MSKRVLFFLSVALVNGMFISAASVITYNEIQKSRLEAASIPDNVYKIIENSCMECHSKSGKKKAMSHLNFSEWDNYSAEKKSEKSGEIIKVLKKGDMPPKAYRKIKPESVPTSDQVDQIIRWAETFVTNK